MGGGGGGGGGGAGGEGARGGAFSLNLPVLHAARRVESVRYLLVVSSV